MKVLVTRPAAQAVEWVAQLHAQGLDAAALPLIGIAPARDPAAVRAAWARLADDRLLVFVSPNAAEQFFALRPADVVWPAGLQVGSPGPGTTRCLVALGVPVETIVEPAADAPQFDSEALWARLAAQPWAGARVLVVRGDGGRDWLAETLREQGAQVDFVSAYERCTPRLDAAQRALLAEAIARPRGHLWFFSSSEAIDHLQALAPQARWDGALAVATHPRIVTRARQAGFAQVHPTRPSLDAVVACIQSIEPLATP